MFLLLFFFTGTDVHSFSSVSTTLKDTYRIMDSTTVHVERALTFTNQVPDLYVREYTFSFYNNQKTRSFTVYEDTIPAQFRTQRSGESIQITVTLQRPAIGIGKSKTITVSYNLADYLQDGGLYKELIISPSRLSENEDIRDYIIEVISPQSFAAVSIAKPLGERVDEHTYRWSQVQSFDKGNLYIAYGSEALYEVELQYALENKYPYPREIAIPFPPDGAWQQVIIDRIEPAPEETYVDDDDNFMGTYTIPASSVLNVTFKGVVRLITQPRPEVQTYMRERYTPQLLGSRYLAQQEYWTIPAGSSSLQTPKDIYSFVVDTLSYDDTRISADLKRMGAAWALSNPRRAICMEYTDLFIAVARENNMPAREAVGYGVTQDESLLPRSFLGDLLHAWPEYYDRARELWHPVDPTWGDTAELDYFASFDLSHIAFVYHGTSADYPYPPGVYKTKTNTKDVYVRSTLVTPQVTNKVLLSTADVFRFFGSKKQARASFLVRSESNVFQYNLVLTIKDEQGRELGSDAIAILAPYQSIARDVVLTPPAATVRVKGNLTFYINGQAAGVKPYESYSSLYSAVLAYWHYLALGCIGAGLVVFVVIKLRR